MALTTDAQAILLLCSPLGLTARSNLEPLTLREWNPLARQLHALGKRPAALLGLAAADLQGLLGVLPTEAERLARLLERGGTLAIAVERLATLGIWVVTRADSHYPLRLRQRLKEGAPTVLFGAGSLELPGQTGLAVVGSRNVDGAGQLLAEWVGSACAQSRLVVYSGGARGVDTVALNAALGAQGRAVGVLADSLERAIRMPDARAALTRRMLTLMTPYAPNADFTVGGAMGRNRLIYALADYALVVACEKAGQGGTWSGAMEALKGGWVPVFVAEGPTVPGGNRELLQQGALPFPAQVPGPAGGLLEWLAEHAVAAPKEEQDKLF